MSIDASLSDSHLPREAFIPVQYSSTVRKYHVVHFEMEVGKYLFTIIQYYAFKEFSAKPHLIS